MNTTHHWFLSTALITTKLSDWTFYLTQSTPRPLISIYQKLKQFITQANCNLTITKVIYYVHNLTLTTNKYNALSHLNRVKIYVLPVWIIVGPLCEEPVWCFITPKHKKTRQIRIEIVNFHIQNWWRTSSKIHLKPHRHNLSRTASWSIHLKTTQTQTNQKILKRICFTNSQWIRTKSYTERKSIWIIALDQST